MLQSHSSTVHAKNSLLGTIFFIHSSFIHTSMKHFDGSVAARRGGGRARTVQGPAESNRATGRADSAGDKFSVLRGITGTGKTNVMAHVVARVGRPTLIVCHNKTLAAQLSRELSACLPGDRVHLFVSYYDRYVPESSARCRTGTPPSNRRSKTSWTRCAIWPRGLLSSAGTWPSCRPCPAYMAWASKQLRSQTPPRSEN